MTPRPHLYLIKSSMTQFLVNEKVQPELDGLPWEIVLDKTMQHHDTLQKLIIIGDTGKAPCFLLHQNSLNIVLLGVGKSCILARGIDNEFKEEHNVTIGVEFGSYVVRVENRIVKLQIWDTVGEILSNRLDRSSSALSLVFSTEVLMQCSSPMILQGKAENLFSERAHSRI